MFISLDLKKAPSSFGADRVFGTTRPFGYSPCLSPPPPIDGHFTSQDFTPTDLSPPLTFHPPGKCHPPLTFQLPPSSEQRWRWPWPSTLAFVAKSLICFLETFTSTNAAPKHKDNGIGAKHWSHPPHTHTHRDSRSSWRKSWTSSWFLCNSTPTSENTDNSPTNKLFCIVCNSLQQWGRAIVATRYIETTSTTEIDERGPEVKQYWTILRCKKRGL